MENLAGVGTARADERVSAELRAAGIPAVPRDPGQSEVRATLSGELVSPSGATFTFTRDWYYWRVSGPMPLAVARLLAPDGPWRRQIRVSGYAGGTAPEGWVTYRAEDGREILDTGDRTQFEEMTGSLARVCAGDPRARRVAGRRPGVVVKACAIGWIMRVEEVKRVPGLRASPATGNGSKPGD